MSEPDRPPVARSRSSCDRFALTDRVAIVTGSTRGLGRAMAGGLARAGANVVVVGRKRDDSERVAREIGAFAEGEILPVPCDVADEDQVDALVAQSVERFGRIDVLVNNAGISPPPAPLRDLGYADFEAVFRVNAGGALRLANRAISHMPRGGSIINVISMGAYANAPGSSAYCVSKAALLSLTRSMAVEWARFGVRVNAIAPGAFATEMMAEAERSKPGTIDMLSRLTLQRRVPDPEEIVGAVLYLASDASSFVTGEDHVVAGGWGR